MFPKLFVTVSIPKRGFGGFSRKSILAGIAKIGVSIPKRGFGGFSLPLANTPPTPAAFQSLRGVLVGFRLDSLPEDNEDLLLVSIPKRGFGGFSPIVESNYLFNTMFQSLRGVLVGFRTPDNPSRFRVCLFQSLRGVLVGFRAHHHRKPYTGGGFNP